MTAVVAAKRKPGRPRRVRSVATTLPGRDTLIDASCSEGMLPALEPILCGYETNHDEITVADLPNWVIYRGDTAKFKLHCCSGIGFRPSLSCEHVGNALAGLEMPICDACDCIAGHRMRCAVPEGAWPLSFGVACRVADSIGLRRAA